MGSMDEISRAIGSLEASVQDIAKNMEDQSSKIDQLSTSVTTLVTKVQQTDKDVSELKPSVDKLNAAHHKMLGIVAVISFVGTFFFNFLKSLIGVQ